MPKKDTAAERLKKAIARAKEPKPDWGSGLMAIFAPERSTLRKKPDFSVPRARAIGADVATTLMGYGDEPIRKAFEMFDLDPADPLNWRELLRILAEVHFGEPPKRGAKKKWTEAAQREFKARVGAIKKRYPQATRDMIALVLHRVWYPSISEDSLKRYLDGIPSVPRRRRTK